MELLLNVAWLLLALSLGALLTALRCRGGARSEGCIYSRAAACVAYAILIALLLPVISMTDDRMAMVLPADGEQTLRRQEASASVPQTPSLHATLFHSGLDTVSIPLAETGRVEMCPISGHIPAPHAMRRPGRAPPSVG